MFKLQIDTGNAAFDDGSLKLEVARILRDVADRLEVGAYVNKLRDINGNTVGSVELIIDEEEE